MSYTFDISKHLMVFQFIHLFIVLKNSLISFTMFITVMNYE